MIVFEPEEGGPVARGIDVDAAVGPANPEELGLELGAP